MCVCVCVCVLLSRVRLSATPQTAAHQAPLSMGFSRQEHWSGLPCPSPKGTIERKKVMSPLKNYSCNSLLLSVDSNPVFTVILSTKDLTSLSPCSPQPIRQHILLILHPLTSSHHGLAAGDIAVISQTGFPCSTFVLLSSRLVVFLKLKLYYAADTL